MDSFSRKFLRKLNNGKYGVGVEFEPFIMKRFIDFLINPSSNTKTWVPISSFGEIILKFAP